MKEAINKFLNLFKQNNVSNPNQTNLQNEPTSSNIYKYKKNFEPKRKLILLGLDDLNNPSLLIFYGEQKFKTRNYNNNTLLDYVEYNSYSISRGMNGHFPSFESAKLISYHDYKTRKKTTRLLYSKDAKGYNYYNANEESDIKDFWLLKNNIKIPFGNNISYQECVSHIKDKNINFENFRLIEDPNIILNLDSKLYKHKELILNLFLNQNIFIRKKSLEEILNSNPSNEFYELIFKLGSSEVISGLFLELAKRNNGSQIDSAEKIIESNKIWSPENYLAGVKRCAQIYLNCFDENLKAEKINFIKENLSSLNLKIIRIDEKDITDDTVFDGNDYFGLYHKRFLSEYKYEYSEEKKSWIKKRNKNIYEESFYCDGLILNLVNLKSTIQEAEIFSLDDVLGKISYYLDTPKLFYCFIASKKNSALSYFRRYLKRIIYNYAKTNELKYIEVLKTLFSSYTENDFVSKYKNNFQSNYFIKELLYSEFKKNPSTYSERYLWKREDQLLKATGRYEFMPEIWDRHLDDVIYILTVSKVDVVSKAFYFILKDENNFQKLIKNTSFENIISLSKSNYLPAHDLAFEIVSAKLKKEFTFSIELFNLLTKAEDKRILDLAFKYFEANSKMLSILDFKNLIINFNENLCEFIINNLRSLSENDFAVLASELILSSDEINKNNIEYPNNFLESLENNLNALNLLPQQKQFELINLIVQQLNKCSENSTFILEFLEKLIFSFELETIKISISSIDINLKNPYEKENIILSLLNAIKTNSIPNDNQIVKIIETGSSKMVKVFINHTESFKNILNEKFSTLLIFFETPFAELNSLATEIFENLEIEKREQLLSIILDSPVKNVYEFALNKLYEFYDYNKKPIPTNILIKMLEHSSKEVKSFVSQKISNVFENFADGDTELFIYYAKTILFFPNKISVSKKNIFDSLPLFVKKFRDKQNEIEELLLEIGGSNIILDSERALVTLVKIKKEVF